MNDTSLYRKAKTSANRWLFNQPMDMHPGIIKLIHKLCLKHYKEDIQFYQEQEVYEKAISPQYEYITDTTIKLYDYALLIDKMAVLRLDKHVVPYDSLLTAVVLREGLYETDAPIDLTNYNIEHNKLVEYLESIDSISFLKDAMVLEEELGVAIGVPNILIRESYFPMDKPQHPEHYFIGQVCNAIYNETGTCRFTDAIKFLESLESSPFCL